MTPTWIDPAALVAIELPADTWAFIAGVLLADADGIELAEELQPSGDSRAYAYIKRLRDTAQQIARAVADG